MLTLQKKIILIVSTVLCALASCLLLAKSRQANFQSKKIQLLEHSKQNQSELAKPTIVNSPIITPIAATPKQKDSSLEKGDAVNDLKTDTPSSNAPIIEGPLTKNTPKGILKESPKNQDTSLNAPKIEENLEKLTKTDQLPLNQNSENPSQGTLSLPNIPQIGNEPQQQPPLLTPNNSEVLANPLSSTPLVIPKTIIQTKPVNIETAVAVDHSPTPKEIALTIPPAKVEAQEAILDLATLKPKHDLIIVSAHQLRIASKPLQKVHDKIVEEVVNISKNTGIYDLKNAIEKELKGETPSSKTYLAIKDGKIVGFLTGKIEKSVHVAEVGKTVDRFYVNHFRTAKELTFEKNPKEKIEETLMLDAMKKTKDLGLTHFSYSHCFQSTDDFGNKKMTPEHKFFTHLKSNVFKNCNVVCFERNEVKDDYEGGTDNWKHNSYEISNFLIL